MCRPGDKHFESGRANNSRVRRLATPILASCIVATALSVPFGEASAKTNIEGKSDAVSLTAEDAPIGEILAALSDKFGLIYTPPSGLNRIVGGTYSGTLQQVLVRILDGCDYVVSYAGDKVELKILGQSGSSAHPSGLPPQPSLTATSAVATAAPPSQISENLKATGR